MKVVILADRFLDEILHPGIIELGQPTGRDPAMGSPGGFGPGCGYIDGNFPGRAIPALLETASRKKNAEGEDETGRTHGGSLRA